MKTINQTLKKFIKIFLFTYLIVISIHHLDGIENNRLLAPRSGLPDLNGNRQTKRQRDLQVTGKTLWPKDRKMQSMVSATIGRVIKPHDAILEMGTGSGVLTKTLAEAVSHLKAVSFVAADTDDDSVKDATANLAQFGNATVTKSNLFQSIRGDILFNIIFWNPPWYPNKTIRNTKNHELAMLDSHYEHLKRFLTEAPKHLTPDGKIYIIFPRELSEILWEWSEKLSLSIVEADTYKTKRFNIVLYEFSVKEPPSRMDDLTDYHADNDSSA